MTDAEDARVQSWLLAKLPNNLVQLVQNCETASEMREKLESQFSANTAASSLLRLEQLLDATYSDDVEIGTHLSKINGLVARLKDNGGFDIDKLHLVIILRSMPKTDAWAPMIQALKTQKADSLTVNHVTAAITQHAHEMTVARTTGNSDGAKKKAVQQAFAGDERPRRDYSKVKCFKCEKLGCIPCFCRTKTSGTNDDSPKESSNETAAFAFACNERQRQVKWQTHGYGTPARHSTTHIYATYSKHINHSRRTWRWQMED